MPRAAIYARFSTDRQSPNSAEDQVASCRLRAEREGWDVVSVYSDIAISGASNRRPGMTAMLADAATGMFDIVTAEALDRLARNQADIAMIYQRLEFAGVAIDTLTEGRVNELHIGLKGTMGALFLKDLADKIRRGQRGAVGRGQVPGGLTYGYDVDNRIGANGELQRGLRRVNEGQAAVIRRIYDDYLAGLSPKMIAHRLNAEGIPSPRGIEWRGSSLNGSRARQLGVLHNPVYVGRYAYNRVRMHLDPESRKRISRCNGADDIVSVDMPHLRIVSDEIWRKVQDLAEQRSLGPMHQQKRPKHLLSGLVRCGGCGGAITSIGGTRLGCIRHREAGTCDVRKTIQRPELERRVLSGITDHLLQPEAISLLVKSYHDEIDVKRNGRQRDVRAIERKLKTVEAAIARLVGAIETGAADFLEIRESMVARKAEAAALIRECDEAQAGPVIVLNPDIVAAYRQRVRQLAIAAAGEDGFEVRERLRDLIEEVTITATADGWAIDLVTSLSAVVALATTPVGTRPAAPRNGSRESVKLVAKEGLEPPTPGL